ncbi:MAG TPA: DUF4007 family protein, partial [Phycisphaerales bacterium]|nr:DUF4007 family protein [Phycisphaerales bacterium]
MRCSGHESFACRYAWIPKAVEAIQSDPLALDDEDGAMVELGVGRNMVRSIRFWVQAFGVTAPAKKGLQLTAFGKAVFGRRGLDPYLEDARTLWLLHWNLASNRTDPLFAWDFLLSKWPKPEFTRKEILAAAVQALRSSDRAVSAVTLEQHIDIFLRTYCASPADGDALEDELDSPLVQIRLVEAVLPQGTKSQRDAVYSLSVEEKQG